MMGATFRVMTLLAVLASPAAGRVDEAPQKKGPPTEKITLREEHFKLELAADPKSREKGLMGRKTIEHHGGMLFVFPDVRHRGFWMKKCLIDMDLAYLDQMGRIVSLHRMKAEPPRGPRESEWDYERRLRTYVSRRPAQYVIELKAGTMKRLELKIGERIELDRERLVALAKKNERRFRGRP